jgi:hypothetical protein
MCGVMIAKKGCSSLLIAKLNILWYVGFLSFSFLSYYFLEFVEFIFSFQDIYNSWLKKRYEYDPLTHPNIDLNLWLEAGSSNVSDRNQVYGLSNTTNENLRTTLSALIVGCLQSIPSVQTLEFTTMLDQQVQDQTTHLNNKYAQLTIDYEELCRLVMEMRSRMGGSCAPSNWPYNPNND